MLIDASHRFAGAGIIKDLGERDLSMVALTHVHPDHQGAAKMLCQKFQVPLACHGDDVAVMEGRESMRVSNALAWASNSLFTGPPYPVTNILEEGDMVAGFRVVHTPGHTAGHVVFFREADGVSIVGDVLNGMSLYTGIPGLHEPPSAFTADPDENRESIRKLAELNPSMLCFGHGPVLRDMTRFTKFLATVPE